MMVYGDRCGIYSGRELEDACNYRVDFMWLLRDEEVPDYAILAQFRTGKHGEGEEDLFYQYVKLLEKKGETDHKAYL